MQPFANHHGYTRTFEKNKLTLGLFFPLEAYDGPIPKMDMEDQMKLARAAEDANFASLFVRDVPLNDPSFGDVGQIYDPWVFLGYVAAHTKKIALGTGSIVTSFRHPLDVAKAASSLDSLSGERLLLGVATGDRPIEFDAYGSDRQNRGALFRESYQVMKEMWATSFPNINTERVDLSGADLLPKPRHANIPTLVTGHSGQSVEWIAKHGDGWLMYPGSPEVQGERIRQWREQAPTFKPFAQSLYLDLVEDPDEPPTQIHLGYRCGHTFLLEYLHALQAVGVNHVLFNVKFASRPIDEVICELREKVIPHFPALD